ncbi:MAG: DUF559 domain-containing protein [Cumulibacter sp.]
MDLHFALLNGCGVIRTSLLHHSGLTSNDIRRAVAAGTLTRLRHGWYAASDHNEKVASAVRAGGVLSCVSALELHGIWVPEDRRNHVRLTHHGNHRRGGMSTGVGAVQCGRHLGALRPARGFDSLLTALSAAASCVSDEELVAVIDSILHHRKCTLTEIREALRDQPARVRTLLEHVDRRAESGSESVMRFRLARARIRSRPQVWINGVGRVDLLVGQRLVIELDSRAHHTDKLAYEMDRSRDLALFANGFVHVRITYHQLFCEWERVIAALLTVVRRREHYLRRSHRATGAWALRAA